MYSFDIFDTLITRQTATYDGIFYIIQEYLKGEPKYSKYFRDNFYRLRTQSELFTRKIYCKGDIEDITLLQIYKSMFQLGIIEEDQILILKNLEENIEIENIVGIDENIEKVKELVSSGERVVAISDMYLDKDTIYKMFAKVGIPQIDLYVSSEIKLCKWTGNIFRYVKQLENIRYEEWHHIGDNIESDFKIPCKYGILAESYPFIKLNDVDNKILEFRNVESQLLVGNAKNIIINNRLNGYSALGVKIANLIFYPYIQWILNICLARDIKDLYFCKSHRNLLKRISEKIIELRNYNIKIHDMEKEVKYGNLKENIGIVNLADREETKKSVYSNIEQNLREKIYSFYYSVNRIEKNYNYMVYTQLEEKELNFLYAICGVKQEKNRYWKKCMCGIDDFIKYGMKEIELKKVIPKIDISMTYLRAMLSSEDKETKNYTKSLFLSLENSESSKKSKNLNILDDLKKESKIVIYGAGNLGQHVYSQIKEKELYRIVLWVDRWYKECSSRGLEVKTPEEIRNTDFDYLFIAVADEVKAKDIRKNLLLMNVEENKIIWINSDSVI